MDWIMATLESISVITKKNNNRSERGIFHVDFPTINNQLGVDADAKSHLMKRNFHDSGWFMEQFSHELQVQKATSNSSIGRNFKYR